MRIPTSTTRIERRAWEHFRLDREGSATRSGGLRSVFLDVRRPGAAMAACIAAEKAGGERPPLRRVAGRRRRDALDRPVSCDRDLHS